ncbi:iron-sulfur cluster-binding protein [Aspergillus flavus]|uniref:Iron-sulfur cluster-binding protein n=1 Tax=Aspergillus flavus (strain ATCC 200026 / FGSC A1120 / IAM 13836 / NRRL 3357 / JCM 12722 / SRRC 167) TaxID=332952 RepID=A0A7U2QVB1_ASPFN|nr:iron-sulfur cluster-binding protein [Aspergillus flavus]
MEAFIFPTAPTLLALLAGIAFLYRFWPHNLTSNPKLSNPKTSDTLSSIPDVAKEENCGVSKESDFPAGWWVSKDVFELEKRAIFSKSWLCLSHRSRFAKAGDYQSYEVAGFPIFLILGKDGKVRAFHNVCRHRAYTVTKKECGSSAVLGCRYHGWSYNTYGELTKAPHFDEIPGFDRSQNSLFAIHAVTNGAGFVFVNLDASPRISSVDTGLLDAFASNNKLDSQPLWVAGQTIKADFNWKMAFRSKQLIDFAKLENAIEQTSYLSQVTSILKHFRAKSEHFSLFPFTSFHTIKRTGWWCALSFISVSEQKTAIRYDLYCSKNDSSCFQIVADKLAELVEERARELETEYQESFISVPPSLHTEEIGNISPFSSSFKNILDCLEAHVKLEKAQGAEVFPAMRKPRENSRFQQAEQLCKELDCKSEFRGKDLAW